ncbi:hypothetical protein IFR05_013419 [Cadophora sp. M221]|nr:hypothetical protein IFR05_013419 [Cadophora sp. M221]
MGSWIWLNCPPPTFNVGAQVIFGLDPIYDYHWLLDSAVETRPIRQYLMDYFLGHGPRNHIPGEHHGRISKLPQTPRLVPV